MLVRRQTVPKHAFLCCGQFEVGREDREVVLCSASAELLHPHAQLFAVPALHATIVYAKRRVGYHERFVDADNLAVAFTFGTRTSWRVEREHIVVWFFERHTVGFEPCREVVNDVCREENDATTAVAFVESGLYRVGKAGDGIFVAADAHSVDKNEYVCNVGCLQSLGISDEIVDSYELVLVEYARIALHYIRRKLSSDVAVLHQCERTEYGELCAFGVLACTFYHVFYGVHLHLVAANRREGVADASKEEAQVFVNLGGCANGASRIA